MADGAVLGETGRLVWRVIGSVVIRLVAAPARGTCQIVVAVDVTRRACLGGVGSQEGEAGGRVVELGSVPIDRGMADSAILREVLCLVRRIGGVVVVSEVAVDTRATGQAVVVVGVALQALQGGVRAGEGESGCAVVEVGSAGPVYGG